MVAGGVVDEADSEKLHAWIRDILGLLTRGADSQLEYADQLGVGVDEIALQFDDMMNVIGARVRAGEVDQEVLDILRPIGGQLDRMTSAGSTIWGRAAVARDPEWEALRRISKTCMVEMGRVLGWPEL